MWSADLTRHLPAELMSRTLDNLELQELIPMLGVCRRWRQVVIAHRTYWRYIKLDSVSDGAIDFFLARLARSGRRPVFVEVNVEEASDRIGGDVLPAVALHLGHFEYLSLGIHEAQTPAVLDTLSWLAPQLTGISASTRLSGEATGCPLLLNDAPKLDDISLRNFWFPKVLPAVLAQAQDVLFGYYSYNETDFDFVRSVFTAFPRIRRLALLCGSLVVSPEPLLDPHLTRSLELLDVMVHPCSRDDVLAEFPCDIIPVVHVSNPASFTITNLLDMLSSGSLHLTFATDGIYPDKVFHIGVKSPSSSASSGRRRRRSRASTRC